MTLPINQDLPFDETRIAEGGESLVEYMREYTNYLDNGYRQSVTNIDGNESEYIPIISGETVTGTGTYSFQEGLSLRQGIRTTVFFAVTWTNHSGSGNILVSLPYRVKNSGIEYFMGTIQTSGVSYPAGTTSAVIKPTPNNLFARVACSGSGAGTANLQLGTSGSLLGQVFYIGQDNA